MLEVLAAPSGLESPAVHHDHGKGGAVSAMRPEESVTPRRWSRFRLRDDRGSILLLMLFACLAVAVVLQGLSTVILVAERAIDDESVGRTRLSEKDSALAAIRRTLLESWEPIAPVWSEAEEDVGGGAAESWAEEVPESEGWLMRATVRHEPTLSRLVVSASLERGRDGLDLPLAAVVGGAMTASPDRESLWIDSEGAGEPEETEPSASVVAVLLLRRSGRSAAWSRLRRRVT